MFGLKWNFVFSFVYLHALLTRYSNANVSHLNHTHIIGAITLKKTKTTFQVNVFFFLSHKSSATSQVEYLPTAIVMTLNWSRISWTTWLFCSGVDLQQMTALHLQLSSRKSLFSSSCKAKSSVLPSMTRTKSEVGSPGFSAAVASVEMSLSNCTLSLSSSSKAAHAAWKLK